MSMQTTKSLNPCLSAQSDINTHHIVPLPLEVHGRVVTAGRGAVQRFIVALQGDSTLWLHNYDWF